MEQKKDKNAQKAAATNTVEDMMRHLYIIARPEMEGRNTPSEGLNRAADYIESQFKASGLVPGNNGSYRQVYNLYKDSMIGAAININGAALEMNKDFQLQSNNYAAEMRFSEAVFAGYGISDEGNRDDYKDLNVAGKLVIIADGVPADYKSSATGFASPSSSTGKMNAAISKGAAALIIVYNNFPRSEMRINSNWSMNSFRTAQSPFTFTVSENAVSKIMGEDGKNFFSKLKEGSLASKTYAAEIELVYAKQTQTTTASNVIAVVEGSDLKDEYVFITSHYDHLGKRGDVIYYGADDDGSGTTGVIEMAEAFAKASIRAKVRQRWLRKGAGYQITLQLKRGQIDEPSVAEKLEAQFAANCRWHCEQFGIVVGAVGFPASLLPRLCARQQSGLVFRPAVCGGGEGFEGAEGPMAEFRPA